MAFFQSFISDIRLFDVPTHPLKFERSGHGTTSHLSRELSQEYRANASIVFSEKPISPFLHSSEEHTSTTLAYTVPILLVRVFPAATPRTLTHFPHMHEPPSSLKSFSLITAKNSFHLFSMSLFWSEHLPELFMAESRVLTLAEAWPFRTRANDSFTQLANNETTTKIKLNLKDLIFIKLKPRHSPQS